jgi:hypothetical protein
VELRLVFVVESLNIRSSRVILHRKGSCNEIKVGRVACLELQDLPPSIDC